MNKSTSLADNETVIELVSSHVVRAMKEKKKKSRRRLIVALLAALKILAVAYFGIGDLFESNQATAAGSSIVLKAAAPSIIP